MDSSSQKFIAPYAFNGYTDSTRFNQWLDQCLLPVLEPGWTIIPDNASFYKGARTKELIEKAGCNLLYLPPYSPDFNPIENQWATLKSHYKTFKQRGYEHDYAIDASFRPALRSSHQQESLAQEGLQSHSESIHVQKHVIYQATWLPS